MEFWRCYPGDCWNAIHCHSLHVISIEIPDFCKKPKYSIYDIFDILIRNNKQFDQNLNRIFQYFFEEIESAR